MEKGPLDDFVKFNLVNLLEYRPNAIVVLNILVQDTCVIQGMAFVLVKRYHMRNLPTHVTYISLREKLK